MAWNNQGGPWGGGGDNPSPWGQGNGRGNGRGGQRPPDFEEMLRRSQDRLRRFLPGGAGSGKWLLLLLVIAVPIWLATGFYRVNPGEVGLNLVFGGVVSQTGPGLQWNWPAPIGTSYTPDVSTRFKVEIGFRGTESDVPEESLMLTGDENIIDVRAVVLWRIEDPEKFLFGIGDPENSVKLTAEAAIRETVGQSKFEYAITEGRGSIEVKAQELAQKMLDSYNAGIRVEQLSLQDVGAPADVVAAFRDVQNAKADRESAINDAQAYYNQVTQQAEGQAAQIARQAEAYKAEKVSLATGEAQRFLSVYAEYKRNPEITERRLYLETMGQILGRMKKVLIDPTAGEGAVPYLPLGELLRPNPPAGANSGNAAASGGTNP